MLMLSSSVLWTSREKKIGFTVGGTGYPTDDATRCPRTLSLFHNSLRTVVNIVRGQNGFVVLVVVVVVFAAVAGVVPHDGRDRQ